MTTRIPRLLAISDRRLLPAGATLVDWATWLHTAGVPALQVRERDLADRDLLGPLEEICSRLAERLVVLVHRRVDLALAAGAAGVHLPADGMPIAPLRRRFGPGLWIGRSCHSPREVAEARDQGADYALFGPVFATPSKARYGPPQGLARLAAAAQTSLPILAVGGVEPSQLPRLAAAGAWGVAAIRAVGEPTSCARLVAATRRTYGELVPAAPASGANR